jgi:hypothetical protein
VTLDKSTADLGFGYTDNVYQDDLNKVSDAFFNLGATFRFSENDDTLTLRFLAQGYRKEKSNNYLSYSGRYKTDWQNNTQKLTVLAGGLSYTSSQSGATDESYDNLYAGANSSLSVYNKNEFELLFDYGAKLTAYTKLSGRSDLQLFANLNADWTLNNDHLFMPYFELGLIFSSQGYYTRQYTDLGVSYEYTLSENLTLTSDLYLRSSTYPNRKISDILTTERRNGRITTVQVDALERTQQTDMNVGLTHENENLSLYVLLQRSTLTSRSQLEYFNETQLLAGVKYVF